MSSEDNVYNEFGGETGQSDLTLIVEDQRIPVVKALLSIASPVFHAMFEGDFKEKSKSEIQLPGKKYEDFAEFLRCIYPDKMKEITEKNVYVLLPLADEYRMMKLTKRCEKVLILTLQKRYKGDVTHLYKHIQISETYTLEELKKTCIDLASERSLDEFKEAQQTYPISDKNSCKIVELALRRHELDKDDVILGFDQNIEKDENSWLFGKDDFKLTLTRIINLHETDVSQILGNLRLSEQFKMTDVRSKMIKALITVSPENREAHKEEFDLLPEDIKVALQTD